MTENELKEKMDEMGRLLRYIEDEQGTFDFVHREEMSRIENLKDELRPIFLQKKQGMRSTTLDVVYRKGAIKWETKWLEGYSIDHPEILKYRKEGQPTVAFKPRDEHDDDGR